ncbi:MAG TPA: DinB family protein [Candidatus Limnocylindria bacterium]|nr:DinB family protein [Candidatus Limnocylindria bacterium]
MARPRELAAFCDGWADQQEKLLESIRPLSPEQMQLQPAPGEWAIWRFGANMAGGRLYWLCSMLGQDDHGLSGMFKVDHATVPGVSLEWAGWEDNEDRPRTAAEIEDAFLKTWGVVEDCIGRWTLDDLNREVTRTDAFGLERTISPAWVLWRMMAHEVHHGAEISLILRAHGLPTSMNR